MMIAIKMMIWIVIEKIQHPPRSLPHTHTRARAHTHTQDASSETANQIMIRRKETPDGRQFSSWKIRMRSADARHEAEVCSTPSESEPFEHLLTTRPLESSICLGCGRAGHLGAPAAEGQVQGMQGTRTCRCARTRRCVELADAGAYDPRVQAP